MPVRIEPHAEPLPGYRLIERLGGGGFGEVWKAEAPGGLLKAIKFVYGDLEAADDESRQADQEFKALNRVKQIRHPYILTIERFDIVGGPNEKKQLVIVTELADRTLWDRFKEARTQGYLGIPREELLDYMTETAEALDLMNEEYQLQHLDIKPQNLFLVYNHIKVADFGLAKDMGERHAATITGGVTPVYAAPETFDGWLSRFSDQYSLAIVYQELLTGQRPFAGMTVRQLVLQHLQGPPDLTPLPAADRPIVARALHKNPEDRYPTCREFVKALRNAKSGAAVWPTATPSTETSPPAEELTQKARGKSSTSPRELEPANSPKNLGFGDRPQVLPARPVEKTPSPVEATPLSEGWRQTAPVGHRRPAEAAPVEPGKGIVQPSVVLGLGRLGIMALQNLRKILTLEHGHPDAVPYCRLLAVDTDPEALQATSQGDPKAQLRPYETMLARLHRPSHYLKSREGKTGFESWLNTKMLYRIPRQQNAGGMRPLGRLALVDNFKAFAKRLEAEIEACVTQDTPNESDPRVELGLRSRTPRIYIVAALGGATGGGMFLDAAYIVRHLLRRLGYPGADVVGLFFLPPVERDAARSPAIANAYAALKELNYFCSGQVFAAKFGSEGPEAKFTEAGPPFQRTVLMPLPGRSGAEEDFPKALAQAAQWIYRETTTPLGAALDLARKGGQNFFATIGQATYHAFGMHRILWPRRRILQQVGRNLCVRLVDRWMSKDARPIVDQVRAWAQEQWDVLAMRPENLIASFQEKCEASLGQAPDTIFQNAIQDIFPNPASRKPAAVQEVNFGSALKVMDQLEKWLGVPEECKPPGSRQVDPGTMEEVLTDAAAQIGDACETRIAQAVVRLIEQPSHRLAGAEEALRQFSAAAERTLQAQEQLVKDLHDRAVLVHTRFRAILESPATQDSKTATLWKFSRTKNNPTSPGEELVDLLRSYAKCRFQSLILHQVNRLYVGLRGHLSDQIRDIGFCRQRLSELSGLVAEKQDEDKELRGSEETLLPAGCAKVEEAIKRLDKAIDPADMEAFDQRIQTLIQKEYRALVQVCLGPSHVVKALAPALLREAEAFVEPAIDGGSVCDLFLQRKGPDEEEIQQAIKAALTQAAPALKKADAELRVILLPGDEPGTRLQALIARADPEARVVPTERRDEIVFYRENFNVTPTDLEQLGPVAEEAYRQRSAADPGTLHSREDIEEWTNASVKT